MKIGHCKEFLELTPVLRVSPSPERMENMCVVCVLYVQNGTTISMGT